MSQDYDARTCSEGEAFYALGLLRERFSMRRVLDMLAEDCREVGDHIACNWSGTDDADNKVRQRAWNRFADKLDKLATARSRSRAPRTVASTETR